MSYLDHAATTAVLPEALAVMLEWMRPDHVGNPSSLHSCGVQAMNAVEKAREQVADLIGAEPSEVFFTSGGTESNNLWLSCVEPCVVSPTLILTTPLEHHSVLEPIRHWGRDGILEKNISVHSNGTADLEDLEQKLSTFQFSVKAVSVMAVNNEIGTVNPIREIGQLCKKHFVPLHVDAVAAAGHIPISVRDWNADFLSLSGHKFGAPMGTGALYISNRVKKRPMLRGGGQENGMRPGTENVPGIAAMGVAAEIAKRDMKRNRLNWTILRTTFMERLAMLMPGMFHVNGGVHVSPNIISLTIPGVNSESLLLFLDERGIQVSAGSACSASSSGASHVLKGIGMPEEDAACTVRITMGVDTTQEELLQAAEAIAEESRRLLGLYQTAV